MNTRVLVVLLVGAWLRQGQDYDAVCRASDAARALCDAEATLTDALRRNNAATLEHIYADEFQLINFRGTQVNKAGVLAAIRSGTLRFENLSTSELKLRIYENLGVITGRQHQVAREPGGDNDAHPNDVRFTHVFVQRGGQWRLIVSQITPIAGPPPRL